MLSSVDSSSSLSSKIQKEFTSIGIKNLSPTILSRLEHLCNVFGIGVDQLINKWEVWDMKNGGDGINLDRLEEFKKSVQKDLEKSKNNQMGLSNHYTTKKISLGNDSLGGLESDIIKKENLNTPKQGMKFKSKTMVQNPTYTPNQLLQTPIQSSSPSVLKFVDRKNKGKKEDLLNDHIQFKPTSDIDDLKNVQAVVTKIRPEIDIAIIEQTKQQILGTRYMFDTISNISEILDDEIDVFMEKILRKGNVDVIVHPGIPHQEPVVVCGRICKDVNGDGSTALFLEPSRRIGSGVRVQLDFSMLDPTKGGSKGFITFPGQLVVLKGTNPTGNLFCVMDVLEDDVKLENVVSSMSKLHDFYPNPSIPLNIVIAAGPYTLDDSLAYEPLDAFLNTVKNEKPDVVLLMGPFVDVNHPLIKSGKIDVSLDELFKIQVVNRLQATLGYLPPSSKILLIPHVNDVQSSFMMIPQPPLHAELTSQESNLRLKQLGLQDQRIISLPNPCQFTINELVCSSMSFDVVMNLNNDLIVRQQDGKDKWSKIGKCLLQQESLYPIFPTQDPINLMEFDTLKLKVKPDLMILPSNLKCFARMVEDVVIVNPGKLCKGQAGGTFSKICIWPLQILKDGELNVNHALNQRCRVEIERV